MGPFIPLTFSLVLIAFGGAFWILIHRFRQREAAFKTALEINQKNLDRQSSRLNILSKALPQLQSWLKSSEFSDSWKTMCVDEARALVWADGASFWRMVEEDHELELDVVRGRDAEPGMSRRRIKLDDPQMGGLFKKGLLSVGAPILSSNSSSQEMIFPFSVKSHLQGVFHFVRQGNDPFLPQESALMEMFLNQVALALEHKDMVINRDNYYLELVQAFVEMLESREESRSVGKSHSRINGGSGRSKKMRSLARDIARELSMPQEFIYYLEFAALMHDIGNIAIDESLLKKPGKLTQDEYALLKKHPEYGHKMLAPVSMLAPVAPMVLYHQEWFNGKGYPTGLRGEEIPFGARIVGVLDAWSSMTTKKPWRRAMEKKEALNEIRKGSGTQFDPKVVEAFMAVMERQGVMA